MATSETRTKVTASAATQILTGTGRLLRVIVQAAGTASDIYDDVAANVPPIVSIPAAALAGSVVEVQCPLTLGLRVVAGTQQLTIVHST